MFGVVQMGLPYLIFASALRRVPIQDAALLTLFEPILNPLLGLLPVGRTGRTRRLGSAAA